MIATLHKLGRTADVPEGEARRFDWNGKLLAVANLGDGVFKAVGDVCSHALAFLHEGEVDADENTIECPRHGSTFDLDTGEPQSLPATIPVPAYRVVAQGDDLMLELSE